MTSSSPSGRLSRRPSSEAQEEASNQLLTFYEFLVLSGNRFARPMLWRISTASFDAGRKPKRRSPVRSPRSPCCSGSSLLVKSDYVALMGLGTFPLTHVDDFGTRVPSPWVTHGGVLLPMYQSEALWIGLDGTWVHHGRQDRRLFCGCPHRRAMIENRRRCLLNSDQTTTHRCLPTPRRRSCSRPGRRLI